MGTTSPDAVFFPDGSYANGWRQADEDQADSIQAALLSRAGRSFRPADAAALAALSSLYTLRVDDRAFQIDTGVTYRYDGSTWKEWGPEARRQLDAANSTIRTRIQIGIGKITGNGTGSVSEAITFPVPFKTGTIPSVVMSATGNRATGAFNPAGLSVGGFLTSGAAPSATGFTASCVTLSGTFSASFDYYYSWQAIGEID